MVLEQVHPHHEIVAGVIHLLMEQDGEQAHQDHHCHLGHQDHQDQGILHLRDRLDLQGLQDLREEVEVVEAVDHQVLVEDAVIRGRSSPWLLT